MYVPVRDRCLYADEVHATFFSHFFPREIFFTKFYESKSRQANTFPNKQVVKAPNLESYQKAPNLESYQKAPNLESYQKAPNLESYQNERPQADI